MGVYRICYTIGFYAAVHAKSILLHLKNRLYMTNKNTCILSLLALALFSGCKQKETEKPINKMPYSCIG